MNDNLVDMALMFLGRGSSSTQYYFDIVVHQGNCQS